MKITFPNEGIAFTERKPDFHIFIALVRKKDDGKGDMIPMMAPDAFNAGIMAGMYGQVLYLVSLIEMLVVLKDVMYEPDDWEDASEEEWS